MPVTSKDPRVQAALDARRKRVADKRKKATKAKSKKPTNKLEQSRKGNIFSKRAELIDRVVKRATRGR